MGASSSSASAAAASSSSAVAASSAPPRGCLPCLDKSCAAAGSQLPSRDDYCCICGADKLYAAPSIQLACGHVFHAACCLAKLAARWSGSRITFSFMLCSTCREPMAHWALEKVLAPLRELKAAVDGLALSRLRLEGLERAPEICAAGGRFFGDALGFATDRFAFAACDSCNTPYFVGMRACGAAPGAGGGDAGNAGGGGAAAGAAARDADAKLLCSLCKPSPPGAACLKHGKGSLIYKCRYCCSVATWFCWGTTHFCDPCHLVAARKKTPDVQLCAGVAKCPLRVAHPPNGTELSLGCEACKLESIGIAV